MVGINMEDFSLVGGKHINTNKRTQGKTQLKA
jgi:hypothetical protein